MSARGISPLGFAILEFTVWWASRKPRPSEDEAAEMAATILHRPEAADEGWAAWLQPGQLDEFVRAAWDLVWAEAKKTRRPS